MCSTIETNAHPAKDYFCRTEDTDDTLQLFVDYAIAYNPLSAENGFRVQGEIDAFLKVARMANLGLKSIGLITLGKNRIEDLVWFTRGSMVERQFQFKNVFHDPNR